MDLLANAAAANGSGSPRLQGAPGADATSYGELVDKILARRIPEVCGAQVYPALGRVTEGAVRKAAERVGAYCDEEEFGESRFGFDEFYKIVGVLREMQEEGDFEVGIRK